MNPEISIIMPAIRPELWVGVLNSIAQSTKRNFELIIVSPFPLPKEVSGTLNIKYVRDFGSPMRASCIGCSLAVGKYIFPTMADDALFIESAIDKNLDLLESMGDNKKNIIVCKYSESKDRSAPDRYQDDSYYKIVNAYPVDKNIIPHDWWIFNTAFWYREYFDEIGWFDCTYEACPLGHCDLAIRAQRDGANVKLSPDAIIRCDHGQSDHGPIEIAQIQFDGPKFTAKYSQPLNNFSISLNKESWKASPAVWDKRFVIK